MDEKKAYPEDFIQALMNDGWLSILIPEKYGGSGLGMVEAGIILEEIIVRAGMQERAMLRCTRWVLFLDMETRIKSSAISRKSPVENYGFRLLELLSLLREVIRLA